MSYVAVASSDHSQEMVTCAAEVVSASGGDSRRAAVSRSVSLVQVHQEQVVGHLLHRSAASNSVDGMEIANHIRSFLAVPANVGASLASGVMAVRSALPFFTAEPPQLARGLTMLGTKVFDAVAMIIPNATKQTQDFIDVESAWDDTLQSLPSAAEDLVGAIRLFKEEADISALVRVCNTVIKELGALLTRTLSEPVSAEVAKFVAALEDAVEGFDEAMSAFVAGNTTTAVEAVYAGIRSAAAALLPEDVQGEETFTAVVGALDSVFNDLSSTVLMYQQNLLQSSVCWRGFVTRERRRPTQCPRNTRFDGKNWCSATTPSLLDASTARKRRQSGAAPVCSEDDDFSEQKGSWCYKTCPVGTEPVGARCKSACQGVYPVNSRLMCGKSPGTVRAALLEMTTKSVRTLFSVGQLIQELGFAAALSSTVNSLVNLGAGFAHPSCPMLASSQ